VARSLKLRLAEARFKHFAEIFAPLTNIATYRRNRRRIAGAPPFSRPPKALPAVFLQEHLSICAQHLSSLTRTHVIDEALHIAHVAASGVRSPPTAIVSHVAVPTTLPFLATPVLRRGALRLHCRCLSRAAAI